MENVRVVEHPLIRDKISRLRDKQTDTQQFRQLIQEVSIILAVNATIHSPLNEITIETPLETTTGFRIGSDIVLIPILRAGLGMVQGFLSIVPEAKIGYLGVYRNESTLEPVAYYKNLPSNLDHSEIFVLDPMLATGGSAVYGLSLIKQHGGNNITLVTIVSAPEGVKRVITKHPDVKIFTASCDRELNGHGYILPGLGDAGDRLNGTF
jgi:uracil phosphoribosyltransferase